MITGIASKFYLKDPSCPVCNSFHWISILHESHEKLIESLRDISLTYEQIGLMFQLTGARI